MELRIALIKLPCHTEIMRKGKQNTSRLRLTIRGVPQTVKDALEKRAIKQQKSLNSLLLDVLCSAARRDSERIHDDLDYLAGSWIEDHGFRIRHKGLRTGRS